MIDLALKALLGMMQPGGRRARLSVLIYHRVLDDPDPLVPWAIRVDDFSAQMEALKRFFNVLPLPEAVERLASGRLPARAAAVTFDDGYKDNLTVALPVLQRYEIPATVFVATGFLDGGRMWNDTVVESVHGAEGTLDLADLGLGTFHLESDVSRVQAVSGLLRQLKYLPHGQRVAMADKIGERSSATLPNDLMLSSDEVRRLHAAGIEIGGHTVTHPILSLLEDRMAYREIAENRERLTEITRTPVRVFAYPNGRPKQDYAPAHVTMVKECGYSCAVSTAVGVSTRGTDLYQIPRFTPWDVKQRQFVLRMASNMMSGKPQFV